MTGPAQPSFEFTVKPDKGLTVTVGGVPVVQGSEIQFVEPGWTKSYYSSTTGSQTVQQLANGGAVLMFKSSDGHAYGSEEFTPIKDGLKMTANFGWTGDKPVDVELSAGNLWATPLQRGTLMIDGKSARSLMPTTYAGDDLGVRSFGPKGKDFVFTAPVGKLTFSGANSDWVCFDARKLDKVWAKGKDYLWLGKLATSLKPNEVASATAEWHFEAATPAAAVRGGSVTLSPVALPEALTPFSEDIPIVPTPKEVLVKKDQPMILGNKISVDAPTSDPEFAQMIINEARVRWEVPDLTLDTSAPAQFFLRTQDLNLPPEGYEIRISPKIVIMMGQDLEGLHHAVSTLGQLFFAKDGKLCLPSGIIRDWPKIPWRGVHLFVGPEALEFHQKLWDRVLDPLKFNRVVLECERTQWTSLPGPKPATYMSKSDLRSLFDYYRSIGVEPIPLIQSLGHMDWLTSTKEGGDFALYPKPATAIDPRNSKVEDILSQVWDEAITYLKPATVHFGLDEVANHWPTPNPALATQFWQLQLPFLANIAQLHNVQMMFWGDQCLAPGDAPDAALADNEQEATARRSYVPKGVLVADWHYLDDASPDRYARTLQIWKDNGDTPIASTWFRPENIRGFYLAAAQAGAGTLQTTWVGNSSNEQSMIHDFRQFAALVVAADYSWSGRKDDWNKLGYDPYQVFSQMYFSWPSGLLPRFGQGATLGNGVDARIGQVEFRTFDPYSLRSVMTPELSQLPPNLLVSTPGLKGTELCLAVDTAEATDDNQSVADVVVDCGDGEPVRRTIYYGADVRAPTDPRITVLSPRVNGVSVVRIKLGDHPVDIRKITFNGTSSFAGLRLYGVTAL